MSISVDTMRRIDRWAGVPLCALLTPWVRLADCLRRREAGPPRALLFIELSEMGSAILVDPAMRRARELGAEPYFLIFRQNRASLALLNTVPLEQIITIDPSGIWPLVRTTLQALGWIRRRRIDTVIDLELFSRFTALLTGLSGARRRVGFHIFHGEGLWRGAMLSHRVHYNPHVHITRNFHALVHAAFAQVPELPYSKVVIPDSALRLAQATVPDAARAAMAEKISAYVRAQGIEFVCTPPACAQGARSPLILLNPNASDLLPQRRWAPARFAELAAATLRRWPDALVLLTGSSTERAYVEQVQLAAQALLSPFSAGPPAPLAGESAAAPSTEGGIAGEPADLVHRKARVLNFAGQVRFDELPALYHCADAMVTNDSGPGHFAAVTPLPTVVLFGPETPALYGSLGRSIPVYAGLACSPCVSAANHRKTPCRDNVCLQAISVEQVLATLAKLIPPAAAVDQTAAGQPRGGTA